MTLYAVVVKEERYQFIDVEAESVEHAAAVALGRRRKGASITYRGKWHRAKETLRVDRAGAEGGPPTLRDWRPS